MTGVGGSHPYFQPLSGQGVATGQGQAHHRHQDEIRKDRLPIPKLQVQGGDPTMVTRQINEWLQRTTISLNTWSHSAALLWGQVVQIARQQHHNWLSLTPAQRASQLGLPTTGYVLPLQLPVLEATMRAELLTQVLPGKVTSLAMQKGTTTVDLLFMTFQTYLPSEPSARVDGLATIEAPLKPARTFNDALTTLRTWRQQVLTVVTDLGGNPEPLRLFTSLKTLISSLISSDTAFSTEVSHMYRQTNIKTLCTDTNLLQLMCLLEIELSARAQEDDEERRRKGHANSSSAMANAAGGKGPGKGSSSAGKGKGSQGKGGKTSGKDSTPVCTDYLSDNGCPRGDQCNYQHPARVGKCLRCGAKGHQLASCRRPRRDAGNQRAPSAQPKGKAKPAAANRARSKAKAKSKGKTHGNASWAEEQNDDTTVTIEDVTDENMMATACSFFTSFMPCFQASSSTTEAPECTPLLDTGATHCLLPLSWLSEEGAENSKRIHLRVASGSVVRALLYNNIIYASTVSRPVVSVGQLKAMLDLRFVWDDAAPVVLLCAHGRKYTLLRARIMHHLPLITTPDTSVLLTALDDFTTTGVLWDLQKWEEQLGTRLEEFRSSSVTTSLAPNLSLPPGLEADSAAAADAAAVAAAVAAEQSDSHSDYHNAERESPDHSEAFRAEVADEPCRLQNLSSATLTAEKERAAIVAPLQGDPQGGECGKSEAKEPCAASPMEKSTTNSLTHIPSKTGIGSNRAAIAARLQANPEKSDCSENDRQTTMIYYSLEDQDAPTEAATSPKNAQTLQSTSFAQELVTANSATDILEAKQTLLQHSLPKARQRTNVTTENYTPSCRLFGAYTTRGEGITQATYRFPAVVGAIMAMAASRGEACSDLGFLSAQLRLWGAFVDRIPDWHRTTSQSFSEGAVAEEPSGRLPQRVRSVVGIRSHSLPLS